MQFLSCGFSVLTPFVNAIAPRFLRQEQVLSRRTPLQAAPVAHWIEVRAAGAVPAFYCYSYYFPLLFAEVREAVRLRFQEGMCCDGGEDSTNSIAAFAILARDPNQPTNNQ